MDETELFQRLDRIVLLLENMAQKPPLARRIVDGAATGVGIMSIVSIIEVIGRWIGG